MIRPIDIQLNAAHPELPLAESVTFTGSPSTVLIRGVPPNCGRWAITAVNVAATYPDGSTTTRAAVQSANGVWVATLPATARSGRTENGLRVMADGIDENGAAVTGYILGVADFAVASLGVTPAPEPGETSWQMLYFDAVPSTLRKGDVAKVDGVLKFYNGTAWEAFATPPALDDTVTSSSANGVKSSGIWSAIWGALSALPSGFRSLYDWCVAQLAGKASTADATLTARYDYGEWDMHEVPAQFHNNKLIVGHDAGGYYWRLEGTDAVSSPPYATEAEALAATEIFIGGSDVPDGAIITRTVTTSYVLGPDEQANPNHDKPLASEAEAEALRQGKADKPATFTEGNLAALDANGNPTDSGVKSSDKLDSTSAAPAFSSSSSKNYSVGSYCTHDGKLYVCMIATSGGTWVTNCWAEVQLVKMPVIATTDNLVTFGNGTALKDSGIAKENVALKGNIPYDCITITTGQLQDHAEQKVTLNAATTTLSLPALTDLTGKVSDFGIDVINGYEVSGTPTAASFSLDGTLGTDYNLIVPKGEDWSEMSALAAGEMAVYYFTLSAFQINDKPTWEVMKKVVELVPVPSAP